MKIVTELLGYFIRNFVLTPTTQRRILSVDASQMLSGSGFVEKLYTEGIINYHNNHKRLDEYSNSVLERGRERERE